MKHHKEWAKELRHAASVAPTETLVMIEPWLKQVQLDAMKDGMRRAAVEVKCSDDCEASTCDGCENRNTILTAAEQLTERDLEA